MADDGLIDFISSVSGETHLKVEENLGGGFVRLRISEAERRQAKHDIRSAEDIVVELLRNSRDAHARRIFVATHREGDARTLTFIDDGVGVPASMAEMIFEPRVTTKLETMVMDRWGVHGRGMALFSVRSNAQRAFVAASAPHKGMALSVVTDVNALGERADQSTWPVVERTEDGLLAVSRGPHNIVRRCVEFACEHPEMDLFLGSPSEVLVTMIETTRLAKGASELLFCDDVERLPVWQRVAACADAGDLVETAEALGLGVSERTAHRILAGEIPPLRSMLDAAAPQEAPKSEAAPDIYRDRRGIRLHHTDLAEFRSALEKAFDTIAERYYLHLRCEPRVTVTRDEIRVRFQVDKED